jgi:asparagine synthase (glutamine-hydrolysing)
MGGFVAILNTNGAPVDRRLLTTLLDVAPYDTRDAVVWTADNVGVGSAPLRSSHHREVPQPRNCACRVKIVMDGRLDDRPALVRSLEARLDRRLDHASDVDLVLAAYECWGAACAAHLLGDFAFCVWDADRRQLFCGRDHLGVKPVYYARAGETLVVSNVLRSMRRHPGVSARLDDLAIADVLLVGACMHPSRTSFADVARVPPAHTLTCSLSGTTHKVERYWSLQPIDELRSSDPRDYVERYVSILETVVRDRLPRGPVGVLMSGGLDSSSVAAAAAAVLGSDTAPHALRAYTFVYDSVAADEERRYSSLVASRLGIPIEHQPVDGYRWFERWNEGLLPPEPSTEPMTAMTSDLLARVAQHSSVALTGDGGDPAFVPSTVLHLLRQRPPGLVVTDLWRSARRTRMLPALGIRSAIRRWMSRSADVQVPEWLSDAFVRRCDLHARSHVLGQRPSPGKGPRAPAAQAITDPWWTSMFETYDPGATQRPVELRYPLFDVRFVSFALSLPTHPWCVNKEIVRTAMRGRLPDEICARPKAPLAVDVLHVHGRLTVADIASAIEGAPELAAYIDARKFRTTVSDDRIMTDAAPGTWAAAALAAWLRCAAGASVPA